MNGLRYPVWVEETVLRLAWVEADGPVEAARAELEPEDYRDEPVFDAWLETSAAPTYGEWGASRLYGHDGAAPMMDAHVHAHRGRIGGGS